jgi:hypothetical protein
MDIIQVNRSCLTVFERKIGYFEHPVCKAISANLNRTCPGCKEANPSNNQYCYICGTSLAGLAINKKPDVHKLSKGEKVLLAIENVMTGKMSMVSIGDLFLTNEGLYFIQYASFKMPGNNIDLAAGVIGLVAGGIAGDFVLSQEVRREKEEEKNQALADAAETRRYEYGMSLQQRLGYHSDFQFIPKTDILSMCPNKKNKIINCETKTKGLVEFLPVTPITPQLMTILSQYPEQSAIHEESLYTENSGINLSCPPPRTLLDLILEKNNQISNMLPLIEDKVTYIDNLLYQLFFLPKDKAIAVCHNLQELGSEKLRSAINSALAKKAKSELDKVFRSTFTFIILICFVVFFIVMAAMEKDSGPILLFILPTGGFGIYMLVKAYRSYAQYRYIKELRRLMVG